MFLYNGCDSTTSRSLFRIVSEHRSAEPCSYEPIAFEQSHNVRDHFHFLYVSEFSSIWHAPETLIRKETLPTGSDRLTRRNSSSSAKRVSAVGKSLSSYPPPFSRVYPGSRKTNRTRPCPWLCHSFFFQCFPRGYPNEKWIILRRNYRLRNPTLLDREPGGHALSIFEGSEREAALSFSL